MFEIKTYQNTAESNRVDKTLYLTTVGTISGTLRESTSISALELTIEYPKIPDFNYIYIPEFNRYYFITDIVSVTNKLWALYCHCDVLMTYKDGLYNSVAYIDRTGVPGDYGRLIVDKQRAIQLGQDVSTINLDVINDLFESTGTWADRQGVFIISGISLNR